MSNPDTERLSNHYNPATQKFYTKRLNLKETRALIKNHEQEIEQFSSFGKYQVPMTNQDTIDQQLFLPPAPSLARNNNVQRSNSVFKSHNLSDIKEQPNISPKKLRNTQSVKVNELTKNKLITAPVDQLISENSPYYNPNNVHPYKNMLNQRKAATICNKAPSIGPSMVESTFGANLKYLQQEHQRLRSENENQTQHVIVNQNPNINNNNNLLNTTFAHSNFDTETVLTSYETNHQSVRYLRKKIEKQMTTLVRIRAERDHIRSEYKRIMSERDNVHGEISELNNQVSELEEKLKNEREKVKVYKMREDSFLTKIGEMEKTISNNNFEMRGSLSQYFQDFSAPLDILENNQRSRQTSSGQGKSPPITELGSDEKLMLVNGQHSESNSSGVKLSTSNEKLSFNYENCHNLTKNLEDSGILEETMINRSSNQNTENVASNVARGLKKMNYEQSRQLNKKNDEILALKREIQKLQHEKREAIEAANHFYADLAHGSLQRKKSLQQQVTVSSDFASPSVISEGGEAVKLASSPTSSTDNKSLNKVNWPLLNYVVCCFSNKTDKSVDRNQNSRGEEELIVRYKNTNELLYNPMDATGLDDGRPMIN